jgi:putative DNA primase/helicase
VADKPALSRAEGGQQQPAGGQDHPVVELVPGDCVKIEPVSWLWHNYLAGKKINIIAGAPGAGKTTLALALAAIVTLGPGGHWPDGTAVDQQGDVIIWSGEDGVADTLAPRLLACGADMRRVRFVGRVHDGGETRLFDPAHDMPELRRAMLAGGNCKLLIVDSIVSVVSGDDHKNGLVRRALEALAALCEELGCAVLGISHFSKGTGNRDPLERVTGSLAYGAYARVVLVTAKRQDIDGGGRVLAHAKSNLGPDVGGLTYDIEQVAVPGHPGIHASRIRWGVRLEGTAREILAEAEGQEPAGEQGALAEAMAFLTDLLSAGPMLATRVKQEAEGAGHTVATIRRAEKALAVESYREGGIGTSGKWYRRLGSPKLLKNAIDAQQNGVSMLANDEHLSLEEPTVVAGVV